jgi:hypothetical protein
MHSLTLISKEIINKYKVHIWDILFAESDFLAPAHKSLSPAPGRISKFPLAIFKKMMYTNRVTAGVMGSKGSAACGGNSNPSEWQRSIKSREA